MDVFTAAAAYFSASYQYIQIVHKYKVVKKPRKRRHRWMLKMHKNRTRETMEQQLQEMLVEPSHEFNNFCRMSYTDFEFLLQKLEPIIAKKDTKWRECIPPKIRLAVTLRFLASGDSYRSLHLLFKMSTQIISKIVLEVCVAIYQVLKDCVKMPNTEEGWLTIEHGFCSRFPHAIGAIDGKHVSLRATINRGSEDFNDKKFFSIVLMALVDSNYCFLFADVGCQGRISDGGVLNNSILLNKMIDNSLGLPTPTPLPNGNVDMPYVFLGNTAFDLHRNLMKPYPGEYEEGTKEIFFNKKLSSARVVVENTFGVISSVFRVLRQPLLLEPESAKHVVMACIVLHNFLRKSPHSSASYNPPGTFDIFDGDVLVSRGSWRDDVPINPALRDMRNIPRGSPRDAEQIRNEFATYLHTRQ
ncbi:unnamed protein product [Danaus chrysippus]|uniref:(African queen) hypothetical protein n=1 Tax=Danaus chrysippus TaxID=151541 RepID=A0A8J2WBH0_9NEOP|nr:unnamed protein product [Danaus chrysippus]